MKVVLGLLLASALTLAACAKNSSSFSLPSGSSDTENADQGINTPPPDENKNNFAYEALAWESKSKTDRKGWSDYAFQVIDTVTYDQMEQVTDAEIFCPNFARLSREQKINFWGQLIAGIAYYESAWSPVSRMHETTMGTDSVTGQPVYSEGLLQLSYQDIQWSTYCPFDWNKDKYLAPTDPAKTILDPYKNLYCGIRILADQIASHKKIVLSSGVYWATLKSNGKYQQINGIAAMTKKLSFCQ